MRLCRAGLVSVWSSIEDVTLVFGGPRTGKTGWLAGRILDAPGAVLVTSTRTDLHELTGALRARRGPVFVFNPVGLAGPAVHDHLRPADRLHRPRHRGRAGHRHARRHQPPQPGRERGPGVLGRPGPPGAGRAAARRRARRPLDARRAGLGGRPRPGRPRRAGAAAPLRGAGVRAGRPAVHRHQRAHPHLDHLDDHARARVADPPRRSRGRRPRPAGSTSPSCSTSGPRCTCSARRRPRSPRWSARSPGTSPGRPAASPPTSPAGRLDPPLTLALDEAALISPVPLESRGPRTWAGAG